MTVAALEAPETTWTHVMMPVMLFACGRSILDRPKAAGFVIGAGRPEDWAKVTCPHCRAIGQDEIRRLTRVQQGQPEKPAPEQLALDLFV